MIPWCCLNVQVHDTKYHDKEKERSRSENNQLAVAQAFGAKEAKCRTNVVWPPKKRITKTCPLPCRLSTSKYRRSRLSSTTEREFDLRLLKLVDQASAAENRMMVVRLEAWACAPGNDQAACQAFSPIPWERSNKFRSSRTLLCERMIWFWPPLSQSIQWAG